jgi:hypothetical protein
VVRGVVSGVVQILEHPVEDLALSPVLEILATTSRGTGDYTGSFAGVHPRAEPLDDADLGECPVLAVAIVERPRKLHSYISEPLGYAPHLLEDLRIGDPLYSPIVSSWHRSSP